LVNALSYTEFPTSYIATFSSNLSLNLSINTDNSLISDYTLSFGANTGRPITIVASGFVDSSENNNGADFGFWLATVDGGPLTEIAANTLNVRNVNALSAEIFPNLVRDYLKINLNNIDNAEFALFDIHGRNVMNQNLKSINEIYLGNLTEGLYVLNLSSNKDIKTFKIQVNY